MRRSHFDGMSSRESSGMPHLMEGDLLKLGMNTVPRMTIARDQEDYVRSVYEACPNWRRRKKQKLAGALAHAELVTKMMAHRSASPTPDAEEGNG